MKLIFHPELLHLQRIRTGRYARLCGKWVVTKFASLTVSGVIADQELFPSPAQSDRSAHIDRFKGGQLFKCIPGSAGAEGFAAAGQCR